MASTRVLRFLLGEGRGVCGKRLWILRCVGGIKSASTEKEATLEWDMHSSGVSLVFRNKMFRCSTSQRLISISEGYRCH